MKSGLGSRGQENNLGRSGDGRRARQAELLEPRYLADPSSVVLYPRASRYREKWQMSRLHMPSSHASLTIIECYYYLLSYHL